MSTTRYSAAERRNYTKSTGREMDGVDLSARRRPWPRRPQRCGARWSSSDGPRNCRVRGAIGSTRAPRPCGPRGRGPWPAGCSPRNRGGLRPALHSAKLPFPSSVVNADARCECTPRCLGQCDRRVLIDPPSLRETGPFLTHPRKRVSGWHKGECNDQAKLPMALVGQHVSKRRDGPPVSFSV